MKTSKGKSSGLSKMEAVRRALAILGRDAGPSSLRDYIRDRLGLEMSADHVSANKSQILAKEGSPSKSSAKMPVAKASASKPAAKPAAAKPAAAKSHVAASSSTGKAKSAGASSHAVKAPAVGRPRSNGTLSGIGLRDIVAVKELTARVGASELKGLIDAFTR